MSFNECKLMFNKFDSKSSLSDQFFNFVFTKNIKKASK